MNEAEKKTLAREIRKARRTMGWTQQDLADSSGVPLRTVQSVERGIHAAQQGTMDALYEALDLDEGVVKAGTTRASWRPEVRLLLDMIGATVSALPDEEQNAFVDDLTRFALRRQGDYWKQSVARTRKPRPDEDQGE